MNWLKDISDEIQKEVFWILLFSLFLLVTPGLLTLFYFHRKIFLELNTIKMLLLGISIVVPFLLVNSILFWICSEIDPKSKGEKDNFVIGSILGLFSTNLIFYITLFVSYVFRLLFSSAFWLTAIQEFLLIGLIILAIIGHKKLSTRKKTDR